MRGVRNLERGLTCTIAVAVAMVSAAPWSWAQNPLAGSGQGFPSRPVRYVVPSAAGTGNDIVGRLLSERLTKIWGQQVIADNRVGASGIIGAAFVAKSPPDGYTLFHCNIAPNAIAFSMHAKMPYDHRDFAPITRIGMTPNIIVVHPSTPFRSISDMAAYAKLNPARMSYSTVLVGSSTHWLWSGSSSA